MNEQGLFIFFVGFNQPPPPCPRFLNFALGSLSKSRNACNIIYKIFKRFKTCFIYILTATIHFFHLCSLTLSFPARLPYPLTFLSNYFLLFGIFLLYLLLTYWDRCDGWVGLVRLSFVN